MMLIHDAIFSETFIQQQIVSAPQFLPRLRQYLNHCSDLSKIDQSFDDIMDILLTTMYVTCPRDVGPIPVFERTSCQ